MELKNSLENVSYMDDTPPKFPTFDRLPKCLRWLISLLIFMMAIKTLDHFLISNKVKNNNHVSSYILEIDQLKKALHEQNYHLINTEFLSLAPEVVIDYRSTSTATGRDISLEVKIRNDLDNSIKLLEPSSLEGVPFRVTKREQGLVVDAPYAMMITKSKSVLSLGPGEEYSFELGEFALDADQEAIVYFKLFAPEYIQGGVNWKEVASTFLEIESQAPGSVPNNKH